MGAYRATSGPPSGLRGLRVRATQKLWSLGVSYFNGLGVPQNKKRAFELFQQSMALGCTEPTLHFNLGQCYDLGLGAAKDYLEARRFYKLASAQGYSQATEKLRLLEDKTRTECPLLGKRVVITGTSREDLNGRVGVARSFDEANGRYVVRLRGRGAGKGGGVAMQWS